VVALSAISMHCTSSIVCRAKVLQQQMTKVQAGRVIPVAVRIADGADTQSDWQLLHTGSKTLGGVGQLELGLADEST
jgi:hypothetical protein